MYEKTLRAIGATKNFDHSCKEREYWNLDHVLEDDFYRVRDCVPFENLLSGFRYGGFIVYLDKPKESAKNDISSLIAAAPELLASLETITKWGESAGFGNGKRSKQWTMFETARAAIAKARGES